MGFWSTITGTDARAASQNAVLMEHALQGLKPQSLGPLGTSLGNLLSRTLGNPPAAEILERLNRAGRPVQLNLLAFAMAELDWAPRMPGQKWFPLSNPFAVAADCPATWQHIDDALRLLSRRYPDALAVPRSPLVFDAAFVPRTAAGSSPPPPLATPQHEPPAQSDSFISSLLRLRAEYDLGLLFDEQLSNLVYAEGLGKTAYSPGHRPAYLPLDFIDKGSPAFVFLDLLTVGDDWVELAALLQDELRVAILLQALASSLFHAEQSAQKISVSELIEDVRERIDAAGLLRPA